MSYSETRETKWRRKTRTNVTADLLHNGIDQTTTAPTDERHNFGLNDFSISFMYEAKAAIGINALYCLTGTSTAITFQIRGYSSANQYQCLVNPSNRTIIGGSVHRFSGFNSSILNQKIHIVVIRKGIDIEFYVNSKKLTVSLIQNPLEVTDEFNLAGGELATAASGSDPVGVPTNISISNIIILNRAYTQSEIEYLYVNGDIAPDSTHSNIVAHYPLSQQGYRKTKF